LRDAGSTRAAAAGAARRATIRRQFDMFRRRQQGSKEFRQTDLPFAS
jgi:hypothetical protein